MRLVGWRGQGGGHPDWGRAASALEAWIGAATVLLRLVRPKTEEVLGAMSGRSVPGLGRSGVWELGSERLRSALSIAELGATEKQRSREAERVEAVVLRQWR